MYRPWLFIERLQGFNVKYKSLSKTPTICHKYWKNYLRPSVNEFRPSFLQDKYLKVLKSSMRMH